MAAEQGQQAFADARPGDPGGDFMGDFVKAGATRATREDVAFLAQHGSALAEPQKAGQQPRTFADFRHNKNARIATGAF